MSTNDKYIISNIYWDRMWIFFEIKPVTSERFFPYIINSDCSYKAYLLKHSEGLYKLNITNPGNCRMLPLGTYHISYDNAGPLGTSASSSTAYSFIRYSSPENRDITEDNKRFIYFHSEREYRVDFSDNDVFSFTSSDGQRTDIKKRIKIKTRLERRRHRIAKAVLRTVYNFDYFKYRKLSKHKEKNILLFSDQSEEMGSNMAALKDGLIRAGYKPEESLRAVTTKHYSFLHWMKTLKKLAKADYIFLDDHSQTTDWLTIKGATITQIWHAGAGFKSTGYSRFGMNASPAPVSGHRQYDYGITGSRNIRHFFSEVWGINDSMVLPAGMPRLDKYLDKAYQAKTKEKLLKDYPILSKRVILFAPTYRGANKKHAYYPYKKIDFDEMYRVAEETDSVFVFKMHPFVSKPVPIPEEYRDRMFDISGYPNINDLFYVTDLLITDYSSNIYEFSLMRKPILFFAFDIDGYSNSRGFHRDYRTNVPGKITETFEEMCAAIRAEDFEYEKVEEYIENNFEKIDSHACDRVIDWIIRGKIPEEYKNEIKNEFKRVSCKNCS